MKPNNKETLAILKLAFPLWKWSFERDCVGGTIAGLYRNCRLRLMLYYAWTDDLEIKTPKFKYVNRNVVRDQIPLAVRLIIIKAARADKNLARPLIKSIC